MIENSYSLQSIALWILIVATLTIPFITVWGIQRKTSRANLALLPIPLFWHSKKHGISTNPSFEAMFKDNSSAITKEALRLSQLSQMTHTVQVGSVSWLGSKGPKSVNLTCYPSGKGIIGTVEDLTQLEVLQKYVSELLESQSLILEYVGPGMAIFSDGQFLRYYNHSFGNILNLDKKYLSDKPDFERLIRDMRNNQTLPAMNDFDEYLRERSGLFFNIFEPIEEVVHVPDGRALKIVYAPHPSGGLIMVVEDITAQVALERYSKMASKAQKDTLNAIRDPALIFSSDGKLRQINKDAHSALGLKKSDITIGMHARDFITKLEKQVSNKDIKHWSGLFSNAKTFSDSVKLASRKNFKVRGQPIGEGDCLVLFEQTKS